MFLAFDTPPSNCSTRRHILFTYRTNRTVAGLLKSTQNHAYLVSLSQSGLQTRALWSNQKHRSSTRVTCRNILLNDSNNRHFILQTCFTVNTIAFLCIKLVTLADIDTSRQEYFTGSTLITNFTTKSYHKKVIKGSNHIIIL